ncbi:hypothetical protein Tco_0929591 [Tanacetum coccineum]
MKDDIKKQFDWDETRNECEVEGGTNGRLSEADKLDFPKDQSPGWLMANIRNKIFHLEPNVREEVRKLKDDVANLESANKYFRQRPAPSTRRKKDDVIVVSPDVPAATVVRLQSLSAVGNFASVTRISVDVDGKVAASPEKLWPHQLSFQIAVAAIAVLPETLAVSRTWIRLYDNDEKKIYIGWAVRILLPVLRRKFKEVG